MLTCAVALGRGGKIRHTKKKLKHLENCIYNRYIQGKISHFFYNEIVRLLSLKADPDRSHLTPVRARSAFVRVARIVRDREFEPDIAGLIERKDSHFAGEIPQRAEREPTVD